MSILSIPNVLNHNYIGDFLRKFGNIFKKVDSMEGGFQLDCSRNREVTLVGILLIYKLMDFAHANRCFSSPTIVHKDDFYETLEKYSFLGLMRSIMNNDTGFFKRDPDYGQLRINLQLEQFIIAPQPMLRTDHRTQDALRTYYSRAISSFYEDMKAQMVLQCVNEVALNFWKHALADPNSILVAEGNRFKVEIACADTGDGIISTLKQGIPHFRDLSHVEILKRSVLAGVTSKPRSNHMGMGLRLLDRFATLTNGIFHIYSEGAFYKNVGGRVSAGLTGYWKGTVIYLNLPLAKIVTIQELIADDYLPLDDISINLG